MRRQDPDEVGTAMRKSSSYERRALQSTVAVLALIPISAGLGGIVFADLLQVAPDIQRDATSHFRYLSGLLLAIGLCYWRTVPKIEREGLLFRTLTLIVFIGGLARLYSMALEGVPSIVMIGALLMELIVTPALALWRERIEKLFECAGTDARPVRADSNRDVVKRPSADLSSAKDDRISPIIWH